MYDIDGEYDKAIAEYSEAIRLDPNVENFHASRSGAYRARAILVVQSPTLRRTSG